jgi:DNA end-binding protein Ku
MAGSIWKGSISFGLLNIPVNLQKAQQEKELSFSMLDEKDLSPIKYKKVNGKTGHEVPWNRIVKGYEYESGQYVIMNKDDFKAANPKATQAIDIEDFIDFEEVDLMFFEKPYYLVPQKNGIKGYFLLVEALKKTNKVAVGKVVIRNKQHLVLIMSKDGFLVMEMLHFANEVLQTSEAKYLKDIDKPKLNPKELKMATELIEGMTSKWNPEAYKDTYHDDLMKIIKMKAESGGLKEIDYGDLIKEEKGSTGKVVDLMPLLRKSLEEKRKGKTTEKTTASHKKKAKKTSRRKAG